MKLRRAVFVLILLCCYLVFLLQRRTNMLFPANPSINLLGVTHNDRPFTARMLTNSLDKDIASRTLASMKWGTLPLQMGKFLFRDAIRSPRAASSRDQVRAHQEEKYQYRGGRARWIRVKSNKQKQRPQSLWALQSAGKKPIDRLSRDQLRVNDRKYLSRPRQTLKTHREFIDVISTNEVPGLSRLLSTAKIEGWGVGKIHSKALLAVDGKYHARNYTELDKDVVPPFML
ncbi:hypothetical protein R3P38DRAFT_2781449 [Favolaschia claudopus]|uniref:Uncharacterized protein n=1 Tax=Favolaschia claudopus TaxID=2862362 RepID=A0AAW0B4P8_9AGAR